MVISLVVLEAPYPVLLFNRVASPLAAIPAFAPAQALRYQPAADLAFIPGILET
jgi:hypothetical protein